MFILLFGYIPPVKHVFLKTRVLRLKYEAISAEL